MLLGLDRAHKAADELRQLVSEQPLRDRPALLLMRALHRLGASADHLAVYADHRRALAEELGLDPSPELDQAQRNILERTPHRARNSGRTHTRPDDTTGDATGETIELPTVTVSDREATLRLIGRDEDIEQIRALTARHRCVTLIGGPDGVGKTALARAVAATEQVVWWDDLASVSTEEGVRATVAAALRSLHPTTSWPDISTWAVAAIPAAHFAWTSPASCFSAAAGTCVTRSGSGRARAERHPLTGAGDGPSALASASVGGDTGAALRTQRDHERVSLGRWKPCRWAPRSGRSGWSYDGC